MVVNCENTNNSLVWAWNATLCCMHARTFVWRAPQSIQSISSPPSISSKRSSTSVSKSRSRASGSSSGFFELVDFVGDGDEISKMPIPVVEDSAWEKTDDGSALTFTGEGAGEEGGVTRSKTWPCSSFAFFLRTTGKSSEASLFTGCICSSCLIVAGAVFACAFKFRATVSRSASGDKASRAGTGAGGSMKKGAGARSSLDTSSQQYLRSWPL